MKSAPSISSAPLARLVFVRWMLTVLLGAASASVLGQEQPERAAERPASPVHRLPDGRAGESYEYLVAVQGLVEPIQYQWNGELPKGLQAAGPRCWGVPEQATPKQVSLTVTVVDALGASLQQRYALAIRPPLTPLRLATNTLPTFVIGQSVDHEITASGGEGTYQWNEEVSALPEGLRVELSAARDRCFFRGTPKKTGDIRLAVTVSDSLSSVGPVTLTGRVGPAIAPALEITSATLPVARYKIQYTQTLVASGGLPPYAWSFQPDDPSALDWLSLIPSTGVLSGVPPRIGSARLSVTVVDSLGNRAEKAAVDLRVERPTESQLTVHPPSLPRAVVGLSYSAEIVAAGSQGHVRWHTEGLPEWLKPVTNGATLQLSGQPAARGKASFAISAEDFDVLESGPKRQPTTIGSVSPVRYELEVVEPKPEPQPLRVLTQVLPDAIVGSRFQADIAARGGEGAIRFEGSASNATWLEIASSGRLSGTPNAAGNALVQIRAVDAVGNTSPPVALRLTAVAMGGTEMTLADVPKLVAVKGQPFSFEFNGVGGVLPYRMQVEGDWPAGLLFDVRSNRVAGVPERAGQFALRLTARDSSQNARVIEKQVQLSVLNGESWYWLVQPLILVVVATLAVATLIWISKLRPFKGSGKKGSRAASWKP